jgi:hypothetical protein
MVTTKRPRIYIHICYENTMQVVREVRIEETNTVSIAQEIIYRIFSQWWCLRVIIIFYLSPNFTNGERCICPIETCGFFSMTNSCCCALGQEQTWFLHEGTPNGVLMVVSISIK